MTIDISAHPSELVPTTTIELTNDLVSKYWLYVIKAPNHLDCWGWSHIKTKDGYGLLSHLNKSLRAHRVSYTIHNGEIPKGYLVCHACDNPTCSNPLHLFLGTVIDNNADAIAKGRIQNKRYRIQPVPEADRKGLLAQMIRERMRAKQIRGLRKGFDNKPRLTEIQVCEICQLLVAGGRTLQSIGDQFAVTNQCVYAIKSGRIWKTIGSQYGFVRKGV